MAKLVSVDNVRFVKKDGTVVEMWNLILETGDCSLFGKKYETKTLFPAELQAINFDVKQFAALKDKNILVAYDKNIDNPKYSKLIGIFPIG